MKCMITHIYEDYIIIEKFKSDEGYVLFNFNKNIYLLSEYNGEVFKVNFKYDFLNMTVRQNVQNFINNYGE